MDAVYELKMLSLWNYLVLFGVSSVDASISDTCLAQVSMTIHKTISIVLHNQISISTSSRVLRPGSIVEIFTIFLP